MRFALLALALSGGLAAAAPALVGQAPADGATGVHPLASLTLTFSEDVMPESAALLSLRRAGSRRPISVVAAQSNFVSANGSVVTVVFPTRQVLTGRVGVEVEPGAFKARSNGASFAGIGEGAWTFSFDAPPGCANFLGGPAEGLPLRGVFDVGLGAEINATTSCDFRIDGAYTLIGYTDSAMGGDLTSARGTFNASMRTGSATVGDARNLVRASSALAVSLSATSANSASSAMGGGVSDYSHAFRMSIPKPGAQQLTLAATCSANAVENDSDRFGNDLMSVAFPSDHSDPAGACAAACCGHAQCASWSMSTRADTPFGACNVGDRCCYLKSTAGSPSYNAGGKSGTVTRTNKDCSDASFAPTTVDCLPGADADQCGAVSLPPRMLTGAATMAVAGGTSYGAVARVSDASAATCSVGPLGLDGYAALMLRADGSSTLRSAISPAGGGGSATTVNAQSAAVWAFAERRYKSCADALSTVRSGDLLGWWSMASTRAGDGKIRDLSGNGRDLVPADMARTASGGLGALSLDGTASRADGAAGSGPEALRGDMPSTVCAWVRWEASSWGTAAAPIFSFSSPRTARTNQGFSFVAPGGRPGLGFQGVRVLTRDSVLSPLTWHHVCASRTGSGAKLANTRVWVDGAMVSALKLDSDAAIAGSPDETAAVDVIPAPVAVGVLANAATGTAAYWNGFVRDVRLYSRSLSTAEVRDVMTFDGVSATVMASAVSAERQLIGEWDFDATGATSSASTAAVRDVVGSNDCTLEGTAKVVDGALVLDGQGHAKCGSVPKSLSSYSLEVTLTLSDLVQRGGGAMTLSDGASESVFDSLVYGEARSGEWIDSSDLAQRTSNLQPPPETASPTDAIHMVMTVASSGVRAIYRNGARITQHTASLQAYTAGTSAVLFGCRHEDCSGTGTVTTRRLKGRILHARLYQSALSEAEVRAVYATGTKGVARVPPSMRSGERTLVLPPGDSTPVTVTAKCDMDAMGGGWTRFWWVGPEQTSWPSGESDVLGGTFGSCSADAKYCFGKMPSDIREDRAQLLARDSTGTAYVWDFDPDNEVAHAAWEAFSEGKETEFDGTSGTVTWNPSAVLGGTFHGRDQKHFLYRYSNGVRSFLLDDDQCSCFSTLEAGYTLCQGTEQVSNSLGVDKLNGEGCTSPGFSTSVELFVRERPSTESAAVGVQRAVVFVRESEPVVRIPVERTGPLSDAAAVSYMTVDGTGVAGTNYVAARGRVAWAAGEGGSKSIIVPIILDTSLGASDKTFSVKLLAPEHASLSTAADETSVTIRVERIGLSGTPGPLTFEKEGGSTDVQLNIAAQTKGGRAFSSGADTSSGSWFSEANAIDGDYGQLQAFRPDAAAPLAGAGSTASPNMPFIGVVLPERTLIDHVAFGRDNTGVHANYWRGQVAVEVTTAAAPDANTLQSEWTLVDTVTMTTQLRRLYAFNSPTDATALRQRLINSTSEVIIIDELEVYQAGAVPSLTSGMLAQYTFEAATVSDPTKVVDTSGNGNDAAVNGLVTFGMEGSFAAARFPKRASDTAVPAYLEVPALKNFAWNQAFTASVLVKRVGSGGFAGVLGNGRGVDGSFEIRMTPSNGGQEVGVSVNTVGGHNSGEFVLRGQAVPVGDWHHIVLTYGNNATSLWIDGEELIKSVSGTVVRVDQPLLIGVSGNPNKPAGSRPSAALPAAAEEGLDGFVHDVRIYNKTFTGVDVAALWRTFGRMIKREGLAAWWRLAESSGTVIVDDSGKSVTGATSQSGTIWGDGGLILDGTAGSASSSSALASLSGDAAFSVCAWVYPSRSSWQTSSVEYIVGLDGSAAGTWFALALRGGIPSLEFGGGTHVRHQTGALLGLGQWVHVCFTKSPGVKVDRSGQTTPTRLFVNGVEAAVRLSYAALDGVSFDQANAAPNLAATNKLTVGAIGGAGFFKGVVADVRVFSQAISQRQVSLAFNGGRVLAWGIHEGQGGTVYSADGETTGVAGTLSGSTWSWNGTFLSFASRGDGVQSTGSSVGVRGDAALSLCAWVFYTPSAWPTASAATGSNGVVEIAGFAPTVVSGGSGGSTAASMTIANTGFVLSVVNGLPAVDFGGGVFVVADGAATLLPRRWAQVCAVKSPGAKSTTTKLYIDGSLVPTKLADMSGVGGGLITAILDGRPSIQSVPFRVATVSPTDDVTAAMRPSFVGVVDSVSLFRRALDEATVGAINFASKFDHVRDYALSLQGTNEHATITPFLLGSSDVTVEMWAFCQDTSKFSQTLFDFGNSPSSSRITAYLAPEYPYKLRVSVQNSFTEGESMLETNAGFSRGRWLHVAYTQSGTTGTIFLDGTPVRTGTMPQLASAVRAKMLLGKSIGPSQSSFYGKLDEVRIWSVARTAAEITAGIAFFPFPTLAQADEMKLQAYIPFDIVHSSPHHDEVLLRGASPAKDQSGHGRDATVLCEDPDAASLGGSSSSSSALPAGLLARTCVVASPRSATRSLCNNGFREVGEECDDGNTVSGDGCSSTCTIEPGWVCEHEDFSAADICVEGKIIAMDGFETTGNPAGMPSAPVWSPSRGSAGAWTLGGAYAYSGSSGLRILQKDATTSSTGWVTFGQAVVSGVKPGVFLKLRYNVRKADFAKAAAPLVLQLTDGTQNPAPTACLSEDGCGTSRVYSICVNAGALSGCDERASATMAVWTSMVTDLTHKFTSKYGRAAAPSSVRVRLIAAADDSETEVWLDDFRVVSLNHAESCGQIAASASGGGDSLKLLPESFVRFPSLTGATSAEQFPNWHFQTSSFPKDEFSISLWVSFTSSSSLTLFDTKTPGGDRPLRVWLYPSYSELDINLGNSYAYFYGQGSWGPTAANTRRAWTHLGISFSAKAVGCAGRIRGYADGALLGEQCTGGGGIASTVKLLLQGRWANNLYSDLSVDTYNYDRVGPGLSDFAIFGKELTSQEMRELATSAMNKSRTDLFALWTASEANFSADPRSWSDSTLNDFWPSDNEWHLLTFEYGRSSACGSTFGTRATLDKGLTLAPAQACSFSTYSSLPIYSRVYFSLGVRYYSSYSSTWSSSMLYLDIAQLAIYEGSRSTSANYWLEQSEVDLMFESPDLPSSLGQKTKRHQWGYLTSEWDDSLSIAFSPRSQQDASGILSYLFDHQASSSSARTSFSCSYNQRYGPPAMVGSDVNSTSKVAERPSGGLLAHWDIRNSPGRLSYLASPAIASWPTTTWSVSVWLRGGTTMSRSGSAVLLSFSNSSRPSDTLEIRVGGESNFPVAVAMGPELVTLPEDAATLATGTWKHLVVSRDSSTGMVVAFIERQRFELGSLAPGRSAPGPTGCIVVGAPRAADAACAGNQLSSSRFDGNVAQLSVWSHVLDGGEVADLFEAAPSTYQSGLAYAWLAGSKAREAQPSTASWHDLRSLSHGAPALEAGGSLPPLWKYGAGEAVAASCHSDGQGIDGNYNSYATFETASGNKEVFPRDSELILTVWKTASMNSEYATTRFSVRYLASHAEVEATIAKADNSSMIMVQCAGSGCRLSGTASSNSIFAAFQSIGATHFPSGDEPYLLIGQKQNRTAVAEKWAGYQACVVARVEVPDILWNSLSIDSDGNRTEASSGQPGLNVALVNERKRTVVAQAAFSLALPGLQGVQGLQRFLEDAPADAVLVGAALAPADGLSAGSAALALLESRFGVAVPRDASRGSPWVFLGVLNASAGTMPSSSGPNGRVDLETRLACVVQSGSMVAPENLFQVGSVVGYPLAMQPEVRSQGFVRTRETSCGEGRGLAAFDVDAATGAVVLRNPQAIDTFQCSSHRLFVGAMSARFSTPWHQMRASSTSGESLWEIQHLSNLDPAGLDVFAEMRCLSSNNSGFVFRPASSGVVTDSAQYQNPGAYSVPLSGFFALWNSHSARAYLPTTMFTTPGYDGDSSYYNPRDDDYGYDGYYSNDYYSNDYSSNDYSSNDDASSVDLTPAACLVPDHYGGGRNSMPADKNAEVRFRVDVIGKLPSFDSGWNGMYAGWDERSYRAFPHGLGALPQRVRALMRVDDDYSNLQGMHSECDRVALATESYPGDRSGCVVAFDEENVYVWLPTYGNGAGNIYASSARGWGGFKDYEDGASEVSIRVQAWEIVREPDYESEWLRMVSGDATSPLAYREVNHSLAVLPERVDVTVRVGSASSLSGYMYFGSAGIYTGGGQDDTGVLAAFNEDQVRMWTSTTLGRAVSVKGGWGGYGQGGIEVATVDVKVRAWRLNYEAESSVGIVDMKIQEINSPPVAPAKTVSVTESAKTGDVVGTYRGSDPDPLAFLTYRVVSGNAEGTFGLNPATGEVSVLRPSTLNYGRKRRYLLLVEVSDGSLVDIGVLTIDLANSNSAPRIYSAEFEVLEGSPYGTPVGEAMVAADDDVEDTLIFSIVGGNVGNAFRIGGCSGELRVNEPWVLDHESRQELLLTVAVTDDGFPPRNDTALALVHILDVNEAPRCSAMTRYIAENQPTGAPAGQAMEADDPENQQLTWTIEFGDESGVVYVDASGTIRVQDPSAVAIPGATINYEARKSYQLGVRATDSGAPPLSCTTFVNLLVQDSNDAPVAPAETPVLFIQENSDPGAVVARFSLVDEDTTASGSNDSVALQILPSSPGFRELTMIHDPRTQEAVLRATSINLDFEATPSFEVRYTATDAGGNAGGPPKSMSSSFLVQLINVNDPPIFTHPNASVVEMTIGEHAAVGTPLRRYMGPGQPAGMAEFAAAYDTEGHSFTFDVDAFCTEYEANLPLGSKERCDVSTSQNRQRRGSQGVPPFAAHPTLGNLTMRNNSMLDFEADPVVMLYIRARDTGSPPVSQHVAVRVHLIDENDPPAMTCPSGNDESNRTMILGALTVAGKPYRACRTFKMPEDAAVGYKFPGFTLTGEDEDGDPINFQVVQGMVGGNEALPAGYADGSALFEAKNAVADGFQPGELAVKLGGRFDFETRPRVALLVRAYDVPDKPGWSSNESDPVLVVVELTDVDEAPQWHTGADGKVHRFVATNFEAGAQVGKVLPAFDPEGGSVNFTLNGDSELFHVDSATGQLTLKTALPGTAKVGDRFPLNFTLSDGFLSQTYADVVEVSVVPQNNPPVVADQAAAVAENSAAGTEFGSILVANAGDEGQTVSFEIESSVPAWGVAAIQVSPAGQLSVKADLLDFENATTIVLAAYAVDDDPAAPAYTPFSITVTVTDADDMPECVSTGLSVSETVPYNATATVGDIFCADQDGDSFTISIPQPLSAAFAVVSQPGAAEARAALLSWFASSENATSPQTVVARSDVANFILRHSAGSIQRLAVSAFDAATGLLDYENTSSVPLHSYHLPIERRDALTRQADMLVMLEDANEPPVIVTQGFTVAENASVGFVVGTVEAYDQDANETLAVSVEQTGSGSLFTFDPKSKQIRVSGALDYELEWNFNISVIAKETTVTRYVADRLLTRASVPVTLTDVNDLKIDGVSGDMPFDTRGGGRLVLTGRNFGFASGEFSPAVDVRFGTDADPHKFRATACSVSKPNTEITCTMPEGAGSGLKVWASISAPTAPNGGYTQSGWSAKGVVIAYAPPSLNSTARVGAGMMYTDGGDEFEVRGDMFGPVDTNVTVEYGMEGASGGDSEAGEATGFEDASTFRFKATDCSVVEAHVAIRCKSAPGVGSGFAVRANVAGQDSGSLPNALSYDAPVITGVELFSSASASGDMLPALNTRGGEFFVVRGRNFGFFAATGNGGGARSAPSEACMAAGFSGSCSRVLNNYDSDASNDIESFPYSVAVWYGFPQAPRDAEADALRPPIVVAAEIASQDQQRRLFRPTCQVLEAHRALICKAVPGYGGSLVPVVHVAGLESVSLAPTAVVPAFDFSYSPPAIVGVTGDGSFSALTKGNQEVFLAGDFFGLMQHNAVTKVTYGPTGTEYTAASCLVTADNIQVTCRTVPGVGQFLQWRIQIANQWSPLAGNTSYAPPVISYFSGDGSSNAQTVGGEDVFVQGDNFGFEDSKVDFVVYRIVGFERDVRFEAANCFIFTAHTMLKCRTAPGAGKVLEWHASIAGQTSVDPVTGYGRPLIEAVGAPGGAAYAQSLSTDGGETIELSGANLGPSADPGPFLDWVRYGPTGGEYMATNCSLDGAGHVKLTCLTAAGVGGPHVWKVSVAGFVSEISPLVGGVTSYAAPAISLLQASAGSDAPVPTMGGTMMTLVGTDFGLRDPSVTVKVEMVLSGSQGSRTISIEPETPTPDAGADIAQAIAGSSFAAAGFAGPLEVVPGKGWTTRRGAPGHSNGRPLQALKFRIPAGFGKDVPVRVVVRSAAPLDPSAPGASGSPVTIRSSAATFSYDAPDIWYVNPRLATEPQWDGWYQLDIIGENLCNGELGCIVVSVSDSTSIPDFDVVGIVEDISVGQNSMRDAERHDRVTIFVENKQGAVRISVGNQNTIVKAFSRLAPALGREQSYSSETFSSDGSGATISLRGCNWVRGETLVKVGGYDCVIQSFTDPTNQAEDPGCSREESQATIVCALPAGVGKENAVTVLIQSGDGSSLSSDGGSSPTSTPSPTPAAASPSSSPAAAASASPSPSPSATPTVAASPAPSTAARRMLAAAAAPVAVAAAAPAGLPAAAAPVRVAAPSRPRMLQASPTPFPASDVTPAPQFEPASYSDQNVVPQAAACSSNCIEFRAPVITSISMRDGIAADRAADGGERELVALIVEGTPSVSIELPTHASVLVFKGTDFGLRGMVVLRPRVGSGASPIIVYPDPAAGDWTSTQVTARLPGSEGHGWTVELWQGVTVADANRGPQMQSSPATISLSYRYPTVSLATPLTIGTAGGEVVTVVGRNFGVSGPSLFVRFPGGSWVAAPLAMAGSSSSADFGHTHARFVAPEGQGAAADVELMVEVDGRQMPLALRGVFGYRAPRLQSVWPRSAPTEGGTDVVIRGADLGRFGDLLLQWQGDFGAPQQTNWTVLSHNHTVMVARVRAGAGVNRFLKASISGQTNPDSDLLWSFSPPRIDDISPRSGPTVPDVRKGDETRLTVTGSSFGVRGGKLTIDGKLCEIVSHTHTQIVCEIPSGMFADRVVRFQNDDSVPSGVSNAAFYRDARWSTTNASFSYDPPLVTGVDPSRPNADGEPRFVIYGRNFGPLQTETAVMVGSRVCANASWTSDEQISCALLRDRAGRKNLTVDVAGQRSFFSDFDFRVRVTLVCQTSWYGMPGEYCLPCPVGALCDDDEIYTPVSEPGFWRFDLPNARPNASAQAEKAAGKEVSDDSLWVYDVNGGKGNENCPAERRTTRPACQVYLPCQPAKSCIGDNKCAPGYTAERCASCSKGHYRLDGECEVCPQNPELIILGFIGLGIVGVAAAYIAQRSNISMSIGIIAVDFFQVLAIFARSKVNWPEPLRVLFRILSAFNLNLELTAPECLVESFGAVERFMGTLLIPVIAGSVFLLIHLVKLAYKVCVKRVDKEARNAHLPTMIAAFIAMFYFLYLFLSRTVFEVFNCAPTVPSDGKTYLQMVFEECGLPGGVQETLMPWAVLALIFYVIGFPVVSGYFLFKHKNDIKKDQLLYLVKLPEGKEEYERAARELKVYRLRKYMGRLYQFFVPGKVYWVEVILARKFLIAISTLLFQQTPTFQFAMMLLVLFGAYALHVKNVPYLNVTERDDILTKWRDEKSSAKQEEIKRLVAGANRKATRLATMESAKPRSRVFNATAELQKYIYNYNTIEAVLLFVAVLTCLSGIMLNSSRFESAYYASQRDTITGLIIAIIAITLLYVFSVVVFEVIKVVRPGCASGSCSRADGKKKPAGTKRGAKPVPAAVSLAGTEEDKLDVTTNPLHDGGRRWDGFSADDVRSLQAGTVTQEQLDFFAKAFEAALYLDDTKGFDRCGRL
ncbi:hypothetical protein FNF31_03620 [Cafeteria roenbergensis]|uniref:Cadherin domain-containing protein n=1 Tax=Cafeteria roenbergensis TaxID=33653 RepID=A0A5A8D9E4_CAFRO|nr:hypothetical protein FNF31_03620 [Cafeteria roenbergensis]